MLIKSQAISDVRRQAVFFPKKKKERYDKTGKQAVLLCSICTGEQTAGFKDLKTGKFEGLMLIKSPADLEEFKRLYDVEELTKEY